MTVSLPDAVLPPLGAVGVETLISIAVLLMGVVGWIVQMAQQGKAQQAARRPNAGNQNAGGGDEKLRDEIDSFLQDVAGRRKKDRPAVAGNDRPQPAAKRRGPVDPFEEPPRRRKPAGGQSDDANVPDFLRPAARRPVESERRPIDRPTPPPKPEPVVKRQDLRDRKLGRLGKKNLGGKLRDHVAKYMAVDQSDLAHEHVQVKVRLSAAERELKLLKSRLADSNDPTRLAAPGARPTADGLAPLDPARLRALLADPGGVRDAIVVNELLSKPLALRTGAAAGRRVDPAAAGSAGDVPHGAI